MQEDNIACKSIETIEDDVLDKNRTVATVDATDNNEGTCIKMQGNKIACKSIETIEDDVLDNNLTIATVNVTDNNRGSHVQMQEDNIACRSVETDKGVVLDNKQTFLTTMDVTDNNQGSHMQMQEDNIAYNQKAIVPPYTSNVLAKESKSLCEPSELGDLCYDYFIECTSMDNNNSQVKRHTLVHKANRGIRIIQSNVPIKHLHGVHFEEKMEVSEPTITLEGIHDINISHQTHTKNAINQQHNRKKRKCELTNDKANMVYDESLAEVDHKPPDKILKVLHFLLSI